MKKLNFIGRNLRKENNTVASTCRSSTIKIHNLITGNVLSTE